MTEALGLITRFLFKCKKISRLQLGVMPGNAPSEKVAQNNGYQLEGTARKAYFNNGENWDVNIYSITREDLRQ